MSRTRVLLLVILALSFGAVRGGEAILLKDIFTGFAGASSFPGNFTEVNGKCYFSASDGTNGTELYISDGFSAGTDLVKDIFSGPGSSSPSNLINFGGVLIFTANDGSTGTELWRSDGTSAGTFQLRDIRVGPGSSSPQSLTVFSGELYFSADDGVTGRELWKTDGTAAGTVQVKDINTQSAGASLSTGMKFTALGAELFFPANDGTNGIELWKTDGSAAGTVLVKDIHTTAATSALTGTNEIVSFGGFVYFPATDAAGGRELWRSNGTDAGTTQVANLNTGTGNSNPDQLTVGGAFLYFRATGGSILGSDTELYRTNGGAPVLLDLNIQTSGLVDVSSSPTQLTAVGTDLFCRANANAGTMSGTAAGTEVVRVNAAGTITIFDVRAGSVSSSPSNLLAVGTSLLFTANDGTNGTELYNIASGGATATLHNINTTAGASSSPLSLRLFDATRAVFTASNGSNGSELYLWSAGVISLIRDINSGADSASISGLTLINLTVGGATFFFSANDGFGSELYKSDTTGAGTLRVKDLNNNANGSTPTSLEDFNGTLYFRANESTQGSELYKSDGTPAGTVLAVDILAGTASSFPSELTLFNGALYFAASDATNGNELQRFDGATVTNVANLEPGAGDSFPFGLRVANGNLFYAATTTAANDRIYVFSGTVNNEITEGVAPPFSYSSPSAGGVAGGVLYFGASTTDNAAMSDLGVELWRADGAVATLVKDINAAPNASSFPTTLTGMNGILYFSADDGLSGRELWRSDGTSAGTTMVKDIIAGSGGSDPQNLLVIGNTLFFTASDGATGTELWKTDGTDAGTVLVKDIFTGMVGSNPHSLTNLNGTLLFAAADGTSGFELWKSDGTTAGTVLVVDINPGAGSSMPPLGLDVPILAAGSAGRAVFAASNGVSGTELWKTNGTAAGTAQIQDINPGSSSSTPDGFTVSGQFVYFRANNGANGTELWALALSALLDPPAITTLPVAAGAAGSAFNFTVGLTGTEPIAVTSTTLPPGLVLSGATLSGVPTTPGIYSVTITATNSSGTATQTLMIVITGEGVSNTKIDTDNDGFADEIETSLGLDPKSSGSTPFNGAPAGTSVPLNVQKLTISLDFVKPNKDGVSFNGLIGLKSGFTAAGQSVTLSVGGIIKSFALDAKGQLSPKSKTESFKLSFSSNNSVDQLGKYAVKFSKGTFASMLVDEGINGGATVKEALKTVDVIMLFNGSFYSAQVTQLLTATAGKKGKTSQPASEGTSLFPTR